MEGEEVTRDEDEAGTGLLCVGEEGREGGREGGE